MRWTSDSSKKKFSHHSSAASGRQVKDVRSEIDRHAAYAKDALAKDKRVNIRISSRDLEDLQAKAAAEGVAYQTLMSSVLHRYVTGRLVEPPPLGKRGAKKRAG